MEELKRKHTQSLQRGHALSVRVVVAYAYCADAACELCMRVCNRRPWPPQALRWARPATATDWRRRVRCCADKAPGQYDVLQCSALCCNK